jgi:hypothetical protein
MRPRLAAPLGAALAARGAALGALGAALAAATLLAPAGALADGDPASDVLLGQNVFYTYESPPVSASLMKRLNGATAAAARSHFPIKVALISGPLDLGVVPSLYGQPQNYAHFLDQEISFQGPALLLVVMKDGYGVEGLPAAATAAAAKLPKPQGNTSAELAQAALTAVQKLSAAAGHPIADSSSAGTSSGGLNVKTVVLIVLVLAAIATAGALLAVRRQQKPLG